MELRSEKKGEPVVETDEEESEDSGQGWAASVPKRYMLVFMCFMAHVVVTTQRANIIVSIVSMVNGSAIHSQTNGSRDTECQTSESDLAHSKTEGEFLWDPGLQALIIGGTGYGQVFGHLVSGRLSEMYTAKKVIGYFLLLSSILTVITPAVVYFNVHLLFCLRILLGFLCGSAAPATSLMMGWWIPNHELSFLSSVMFSGTSLGFAIGLVLSGIMCDSEIFGGWPLTFYSFGAMGCLWFLLWSFVVFEKPLDHPGITKKELRYILENKRTITNEKMLKLPWKAIFTSVPFWALLIGHIGQFWSHGFFNTVHVMYMANIIQLPVKENGLLSALPHLVKGLFSFVCGFPADYFISRKLASPTTMRKAYVATSSLCFSLCFVGVMLAGCDRMLNTALFMVAFATNALMVGGTVVTGVELAPAFTGTILGILFAVGASASFIIPAVAGSLFSYQETRTEWNYLFYISISVALSTALVFIIFGTAEPQPWGMHRTANDEETDDFSQHDGLKKATEVESHVPLVKIAQNDREDAAVRNGTRTSLEV